MFSLSHLCVPDNLVHLSFCWWCLGNRSTKNQGEAFQPWVISQVRASPVAWQVSEHGWGCGPLRSQQHAHAELLQTPSELSQCAGSISGMHCALTRFYEFVITFSPILSKEMQETHLSRAGRWADFKQHL